LPAFSPLFFSLSLLRLDPGRFEVSAGTLALDGGLAPERTAQTQSRSRRFLHRFIRRRSRSTSAIRTRTASAAPIDVFDSGGRPTVARFRLNAARTSSARG
jgi:hypothetical protein